MPPKEVLERIAASSAGDVRNAINALNFTCLKGIQNDIQTLRKGTVQNYNDCILIVYQGIMKKQLCDT